MARIKKAGNGTRGKNRTTKLAEQMRTSTKMNLKDLKRHVVVRGMDFDDVVNKSVPVLQNWLHHNHHNKIDTDLLDKYDDHVEAILKERGADELIHPQLRLGYIGEKDDDGNVVKRKRIKGIKKKRKKRERTKDGIFQGTKKALTFSLQKEGVEIDDVIEQVLKQFPDANTKSIKIWYKKARRLHA